ncbi:MAG: PfkB family carbohydrate kinase [Candidatus Omnitrophota bacterium]
MSKYTSIISKFRNRSVLVIGDLVLDQYIKGSVTRISPEAPVPIVLVNETFYTPGGAANVANNLASLGAKVTLIGKIGDDIEGGILKKELTKRRIRTEGVFIDPSISTIFKTRIIAQHQQVVRVDRESASLQEVDQVKKAFVFPFLRRHIKDFDAIIISDYGKGMIDLEVLNEIHSFVQTRKIPVIVDPKVEDLRFYGQVSSITPNKKEAEASLKMVSEEARKAFGIVSDKLDKIHEIEANGQGLLKFLGVSSILITLGEQGMYLFEHNKKPFPIPTRAQEVFDVSGAGDTAISVFALSLSAGANRQQAADIANYAAGVVVGKMGAVAIELNELKKAINIK